MFEIKFTKQAVKDVAKLSPKLKDKLRKILMQIIAVDPFCGKRLSGDLDKYFSYRLDLKNRIVYSVYKNEKIVFVVRAKTHYGD